MNTDAERDRDFTSLEAWQKAREVKLFFYQKVLPKLPSEEKFNLNIQIRKAAVSGTANIAEGYGRYHYKEGVQFYRISRGSLAELKDHLFSCFDLAYISKALFDDGILRIDAARKLLNGYIKYALNQIKTSKEE
ncbi:four helix bundle protein [candidate division KSB1 bacterium]|nr:four helix bundle protein [candidate division KSB1 bacterium]